MTSSYNSIQGTDSANTLIGAAGADSIVALDGNDSVIEASANDIIDLGDGQDTVSFGVSADGASVYGRGGNDSIGITVAFDSSTAYGGEANDTIWLSKGASTVVYGDEGNDSISLRSALTNATVYGGNTTTATSTDGNDSIVLASSVSNSFVQGNGGNDTFSVGSSVFGGSSIYGGQGIDFMTITGTVTGSTVGGNLGEDTIILKEVVKGAAIYGGGGFEYDTSLDGADSISLGSKLSASSLIQANGGNDTIYIAGDVLGSTVYGGQGADTIEGAASTAVQSLSGSLIAGNRSNDKIVFNSTYSVFNTEVYGSDSTGTLAGNDSLALGALTLQTSTVYGGAGNDTIFVGDYANRAGQVLKVDVAGFAGDDSIRFGGSLVSSTVNAGSGNDTLAISTSTGEGANPGSSFVAGAGSDSVLVTNGRNITLYADTSATDTAGGADSLEITALTSSTVYGAAGGDTLNMTASTAVRFDLGAGTNLATGAATYTSATLIGGSAVDKLYINVFTGAGLVNAGAGADSLTFNGAVVGESTATMSTILGGTGADTLDFNSTIDKASVLGGTDSANYVQVAGAVTSSTLRGGSGADTIDFAAVLTGAVAAGGSGADSFSFVGSTGSSIYAGAGNDSIHFGIEELPTTTYYFGKTDGKDTLSFGTLSGTANLVIAVDAAYGATSGIQYGGNLDATSGTSGTITFNNAETGVATGSLFFNNVTGSGGEAAGDGLQGITFITVSTATITALG